MLFPIRPVRRLLATGVVLAALALVPSATASTVTQSNIWSTIGTTNVTPMWGPQVPKIVYDGPSGWYYTATFDGNGNQYPWLAKIWKSRDGVSWTLAHYLGGLVRMPPALILDSGNRLWFITTCEPGPDQCWAGVPAPGNRYVVRLQFTSRLADGSFNFDVWNDYSTRAASLGDRTYTGISIDRDRRFVYQVYSTSNYDMYLSRFDTWLNTENVHFLATPGVNEGYLYPRVRPGTTSGEVWLFFNQTTLGTGSSATIHGVQLWRSTDYGQSVANNQRFQVAYCPNPDGVNNWCDSSDLVVGDDNTPHTLFFKRVAGVTHLYYWKGAPGNVTLSGSPVDLGAYDNHAQLAMGSNGVRFVFGEDYGVANNLLRVIRSADGISWTTESFAIAGNGDIYSPNLMRRESGTFGLDIANRWSMILSGKPPGGSVYSRLEFVTYQG